jgi:hypothetical protein
LHVDERAKQPVTTHGEESAGKGEEESRAERRAAGGLSD